MAHKTTHGRTVRRAEPAKPPLAQPLPPGAARKRATTKGVKLQAQRLVHKVRSPKMAKKIIDAVAEAENSCDFLEDTFAARWGFSSRKELLSASRPLFPHDDSNWWATKLKRGRWIVWSRDDFSAKNTFATFAEAKKAVKAG